MDKCRVQDLFASLGLKAGHTFNQIREVDAEVGTELIQNLQLYTFRRLVVQPGQSTAIDSRVPRDITDLELSLS